ncbi:hypothetical protein PHYBOEH_001700 [Phytophthora boehmeriae]|uniref:Flavodoxin-like domain-containing protein n=1 Tax=Phytophthora boehmeriae TaxID=109152 RepID=A0A8T1V9C6_9STRA|nr:hypothetical protein PHYBOEH_001700 [Phytophthora boehmeriae]
MSRPLRRQRESAVQSVRRSLDEGALVGGIFFTTGTFGGGEETTSFTVVAALTHQDMIFVPLGFPDDGSRQASKLEKAIATTQSKAFVDIVKKLSA